MSPRVPVVSGTETIMALGRAGFVKVSQKGSHVKVRRKDGRQAIVPLHDELAPGTLRSILRQAGISVDEFLRVLKG
ncbi:type II toxin-antitoxin system HicA family toxin [Kyrpidia tusciae]|uniref:YcfA family protein n=1 Tax=Kyrpidia tusciae (strain DSM 2912 / NBRC 15312 / T2) TaxID=562970 RepID=D5WVP7_KYRT2|nr:type II toxin-antitoxin system HicA family toxin [Kyrpidia tusciae]ADG07590.1 YcfA family protein [Kyrpidia tusciae DSM 2912]